MLTLEELEQSYHENHVDGTPVNGIYHFVLIQQMLELFSKAGLQPDVQEIFAANNRDAQRPGVTVLPAVEERDGQGAVSAHLLRRVYANIALRCDETNEMVTNVAVAYHQKGIQLAIGPMVKVCHNQCIMGRPDVVANYCCYNGDTRLPREQRTIGHLMNTAREWAEDYEAQQFGRSAVGDMLRQRLFRRDDALTLMGVLMERRVRHDTSDVMLHTSDMYPLNSAQINSACENLLKTLSTREEPTWWDAYQDLNTLLHPDSTDIPSVLPQQLALIETMRTMVNA